MLTECIGESVALNGKIYPCTVSLTMDLVGGKWKAVILYHLQHGEKRFSELHRHMSAVTEMTLSKQLKQLENDGMISKKVIGKKPPVKVIYTLTEFGQSFLPVLNAITEWGNQVAINKGSFITNNS
ncbi:MAG TPA: helix-turn-helix domain-containing protein [Niastella sp.]